MPLIFPGSSNLYASPPPSKSLERAAQPATTHDPLADLSPDEPLPEIARSDRIRLIAQSPRKLFVFWNHARDPFSTLRQAFGAERAARYRLVVRLTETESGVESWHDASPTHAQWLDARPNISYRVDVGLRSLDGTFISLLSSDTMQTPRSGVSYEVDESPAFRVSTPEFARTLNEAGYASDALEVALAAADEMTEERATRSVALAFGGTEAPFATEVERAELRSLLAALAYGVSINDARHVVSPALSRWLAEAKDARGDDRFVAERLLEVLRSALAFEFDAFAEVDESAARAAARFVWGASDVRLPAGRPQLWLPSMSAGSFKALRLQI